LFMTWSHFDFWSWLPQALSYVQFSYRLLMFVVLFGSLLAGYALAQVIQGRMRAAHLMVLVLAAGWSSAPYLTPHRGDKSLSIDKEIAHPDIGRGGATTCYRPGAACLLATTHVHPEVDWTDPRTGGEVDTTAITLTGNYWGAFPASISGDMLLLEGTVLPGAKAPLRLTITSNDAVLATPELPVGPFTLRLPMPSTTDRARACILVHGDVLAEAMEPPAPRPKLSPSFVLSRFALQPGPGRPPAPKLVPMTQSWAHMTWGHPTVLRVAIAERSLVQLPVLYYPFILEVRHNGRTVPAENLGRWLALELPPGEHEIRVRVAGVGWANGISLAAWMAVAGGAVWLAWRAWRRGMKRPGHHWAPHFNWIRSPRAVRVAPRM
jgi:hypothetical protein